MLGCASSAPPVLARRAPSVTDPATSPSRAALLDELGRIEQRLQAEAEMSDELLTRRLIVTAALAELAREPAAERGADELLADAERDVAQSRERAQREHAQREHAQRERAQREHAQREQAQREEEEQERDDRFEGGEGAKRKGSRGQGRRDQRRKTAAERKPRAKTLLEAEPAPDETTRCAPGDPLCGLDDPSPAPSGPGTIGAARVHHDDGPRGIMGEVRRHFGRVQACLPATAGDEGIRLKVTVRIDDGGAFREPSVRGSELDPRVASCVEQVFRDIRVPAAATGSRLVTVPLWLRP
jgi:hypothetical protein